MTLRDASVAVSVGMLGLAAISTPTSIPYVATVPEAYELSGLVASPTHGNWYWAHSDGWERTDIFSACEDDSGTALAECQQVQRARLWALKIDPVTHALVESRSFTLSDPSWALNPLIAQNNDWEDIAVGPARSDGDGAASPSLVIAATGNAAENPVEDANGQDITCDTRRLIELQEPNLSDPTVETWAPWQIYDIKSIVGISGGPSCDVESLVVSTDEADQPTAHLVTKTRGEVFARSLTAATGRSPETPPAAANSELPYRAAVSHIGNLRDVAGLKFTAADTNGTHVSLLAPEAGQIVSWRIRSGGLGATLTGYSPVKDMVTTNSMAEGLAYTRSPQDPSESTEDLVVVSDANSSSRTASYWYLPGS